VREWMRFCWRFWRMRQTHVWEKAALAVEEVLGHDGLQQAAAQQDCVTFCPRCGQIPDGDRRMEEARERFLASWKGAAPKRSELDFALAWEYFRRKQ
jgi:hypothetical protein